MATILNKDVARESLEDFKERKIMVTLNKDQEIQLKLKGMKSGGVKIPILKLFKQLKGIEGSTTPTKNKGSIRIDPTKNEESNSDVVTLLNQIRSHNAISTSSHQIISQVDGIINKLIEEQAT